MFITISGTPGTGKTVVAKFLSKLLKARLIDTQYLVKKYKIPSKIDKKRRTKIIDQKKLAKAVAKEKGDIIFEGHMSHFAKADMTVILRASPQELEKRLKRKGWAKKKITENIEAEAIDTITTECKHNCVEIDTTKQTAKKVAKLIKKILKSEILQAKYAAGQIDWSKEYTNFLLKKP